jgi:Icc-related predicted phosphoesterase
LKIAAISDTHGRISRVTNFPEADLLIVAGDVCTSGKLTQLKQFVQDIRNWPYEKIIFVAGNHDRCLHDMRQEEARELLARDPRIIHLQDEALIIDGIKFYGSPWTPKWGRWAFMAPDHVLGDNVWSCIPDDVDVLITHGPAHEILDRVGVRNPGSSTLRWRIEQLEKIRCHIFGHIHEGRGNDIVTSGKSVYTAWNVSMLDGNYEPYDTEHLITVIEV